jgi:GNAT superfamily N-acetyltransferase
LRILELNEADAEAWLRELAEVLVDCVQGGASVSFMLPFEQADGLRFWQGLLPAMAAGRIRLLGASLDGRLVGTAQLRLDTPPNQPHRADVAKVLVHRRARGRGIATALMVEIEAMARRHGRTLLTLDTLRDTAAERLYLRLGYRIAGRIPGYAHLPEGGLRDTTILYRQLG